MTFSQTAEMLVTGRQPSGIPAEAACRLFGLRTTDIEHRRRFTTWVHWGYGTAWGAALGLLALAGLAPWVTGSLFLAVVWGAALWIQPALGVTPTTTTWSARGILMDLLHHGIYAATATGVLYLLVPTP